MSDRGVLAHMHKAILELDKRLTSIEDKIVNWLNVRLFIENNVLKENY